MNTNGALIILIACLLIFLTCLLASSFNGGRRRRGECGQCGYNLPGNESGICPECGLAVEAAA